MESQVEEMERLKAIVRSTIPELSVIEDAVSSNQDDLLTFLTKEIWTSDVLQSIGKLNHDEDRTSRQRRFLEKNYASRLASAIGDHLVSLGCSRSDAESLTICINLVSEWGDKEGELPVKSIDDDIDEEEEEDEDGGDTVPPGHCAMCLRYMPLTFHHLVPKMVQKSMLKKGVCTKETVHQGIDICRPCHSAIHSKFDHVTLAVHKNTLDKLMEDEDLQRWVRYAEKQRVVNKDHAIRGLRYRR